MLESDPDDNQTAACDENVWVTMCRLKSNAQDKCFQQTCTELIRSVPTIQSNKFIICFHRFYICQVNELLCSARACLVDF